MVNIHVFHHESNKLWQVFQIKHFCQNCICELILRMDYFTAILHCRNGEIFSRKPPGTGVSKPKNLSYFDFSKRFLSKIFM